MKIETSGTLSMVTVGLSAGLEITAVVIETPESASYLRLGNTVSVLFKETEVVLATGPAGQIGIQNRFPGSVLSVEAGELLSKVSLQTPAGDLQAVLATAELDSLGLAAGDAVTILIKINEVMLSAV